MPLYAGLYTYLQSKTAITAVVSTRVYPLNLPQTGTTIYPCIVYQTISQRRTYSHGGDCQLCFERVTFNCFASTYKAAKDLAELIRLAISGYRGTWGSTTIQSCFSEGDRDAMTDSPETESLAVFNVQSDYTIAYTEAAPTL